MADDSPAAAIATGVAQIGGTLLTNDLNRQLSHQQMDFQERMSNTQYQRTVQDMRNAGLNPGLLFSKGAGIDTAPAGSAAQMQNPASGIASAARLMDMQNLKKQGELLESQKHKADTEAMNVATDTLLKELRVPEVNLLSEFYRDNPKWGLGVLLAKELSPVAGSVSQLFNTVGNLRKVPGASRIIDSYIDSRSGEINSQRQRDITY